jgi:hypothetical protein
VTGSTSLLSAFAVIAASLLGGCSEKIVGIVGSDATTETHSRPSAPHHGPTDPRASAEASSPVVAQLAGAALEDAKLSDIRGGYDLSSGVTVNFAFQQATYVNHNLTENVVIPTLTISPGQGMASTAGLQQLTAGAGINSGTVVASGTVQTQVGASNSTIQALVNGGMASVIGTSGAGKGGVTTTLANTANNQLIQQMTTIDIGVNGLSKLVQQSVPSTVLSRIAGPNAFR